MWNRVKVVAKPTADIITVAQLKQRLRIDTTDDDELLADYLRGAVAQIDGPDGIGYALMEQTWRLTLDAFPGAVDLPGAPITSVSSITYIDTGGVTQTFGDYRVIVDIDPARIEPAYGKAWPSTRHVTGAVKIDYVLGAPLPADVPQDLIDAACLIVGHRYENREAVVVGTSAIELPLGVESLLARYRRGVVA